MKRFFSIVIFVIAYFLFSSHELFLKTDAYYLNEGQLSELYLFNGTFDRSENIITRDRIAAARIAGPNFNKYVADSDYYDKANSTYFKFKAGAAGTYVAGISTKPKMITLDAAAFNNYLDHEGLVDTIKERKQDSSYTKGANEKYAKHVKLLFQVGSERTDEFDEVFGFPIEFVPVQNIYKMGVGDSFSFKLLRNGQPLKNHIVHYSTSMPGKDAHDNENSTRTDENGIMRMVPTQAGNWYVATIHMEKSSEEGVDYESNWATLTFGVKD